MGHPQLNPLFVATKKKKITTKSLQANRLTTGPKYFHLPLDGARGMRQMYQERDEADVARVADLQSKWHRIGANAIITNQMKTAYVLCLPHFGARNFSGFSGVSVIELHTLSKVSNSLSCATSDSNINKF